MPVLREVWVWPPSGFRDRPWVEHADADAFAKVARAVCDRYSEALPELAIAHRTSHLRIVACWPGEPGTPVHADAPWWDYRTGTSTRGFELAAAGMPSGFAGWELARQQRAVLDVVHGATVEMVSHRTPDQAERLEQAREHVVRHGYGYSWTSGWRPAPRPRGSRRGAARLAARGHYRLEPDGFGVVREEIALLGDDGTPLGPGGSVVSAEWPTWTTARSFRRSDRTAAWVSPEEFTLVPFVDPVHLGLTGHLLVSGAGTPEDPLCLTEWTSSLPVPSKPTVVERAVDIPVPTEPQLQAALRASKRVADRVALALDGRTAPSVVAELVDDPSVNVRRTLSRRTDLPPHLLTILAGDRDRQIREAVATHPSTPPETLIRLAGDGAWQIGFAVALRPDVDQAIVDALCHSPVESVRVLLAHRTDLPAHPLARDLLAVDPSRRVRRAATGR